MKLRAIAIAASAGLTALLVFYSHSFFARVHDVLRGMEPHWWWFVALAVVIQLAGHWLRMLRTKTVIDQVKVGPAPAQFGALGIGYLFDVLLPFRLGEVLRALLIALRLRVSFLYTFTVVVLERVVDLLLIGCLVVLVSFFFNGHVARVLLVAAAAAIAFAVTVLAGLILLVRENRFLLNVVWRMTGWLNNDLCNHTRFKVWSLIFGLQQFLKRKAAVRRYVLLTFASWACYIVAMVAVVVPLLPHRGGVSRTFVDASSPYIAVTAPSGPAYLTNYDHVMNPVVSAGASGRAGIQTYVVVSWLLLSVPMSLIGFGALFVLKVRVTKRAKYAATNAGFANKLLRHEDISQAFPAFLDTYFLGHDLSRIIHRLELSGQLSLVKFFKGGSDAITVLVLSGNKLFVKKIIPLRYESRLKAQYDWLRQHKRMPFIVRVLDEQRSDQYYAIDLAYKSENIPYFEYAHHQSLAASKAVLSEVWKALYGHLHADAKPLQAYPKHRQQYIDKHIFDCAKKAAAHSPELTRVMRMERITINGREYDNLHQVMAKIRKNRQAWKDIAAYQRSGVVHGDPSIDNILVSTKTNRPLIIDPAPDGNIIEGPVFDLAKMMQSFYCGYEFLFRDEDPVHLSADKRINYRDHRSQRYAQLCSFVQRELAPEYLSESEQRALLFHAGALFIRRLKHQVLAYPENTLKFYAVGVKTLNEFLEQYQQG